MDVYGPQEEVKEAYPVEVLQQEIKETLDEMRYLEGIDYGLGEKIQQYWETKQRVDELGQYVSDEPEGQVLYESLREDVDDLRQEIEEDIPYQSGKEDGGPAALVGLVYGFLPHDTPVEERPEQLKKLHMDETQMHEENRELYIWEDDAAEWLWRSDKNADGGHVFDMTGRVYDHTLNFADLTQDEEYMQMLELDLGESITDLRSRYPAGSGKKHWSAQNSAITGLPVAGDVVVDMDTYTVSEETGQRGHFHSRNGYSPSDGPTREALLERVITDLDGVDDDAVMDWLLEDREDVEQEVEARASEMYGDGGYSEEEQARIVVDET